MKIGRKDRVKIGFVGCGGNGRGHLNNLVKNPDAVVAAVCDVNAAAASEAAMLTGATSYSDHREMIQAEELDAVYLSLPPFTHGPVERDVIAKGLPFFVEKPVALDIGLAREIASAVRERNLITCVGYQLRYSTTAEKARQVVAKEGIGLISGVYWCGTGRVMSGRWWSRREQSGGQLVEQATHTVDMMRFIAGDVAEVFAYEALRFLDPSSTNAPDVNVLALRFKNGALGSLTCTSALDPGDWSQANIIEFTTSKRRARWTGDRMTLAEGSDIEEVSGPAGSIDDIFVQAVKTGNRSLIQSDYEEAVRTLAVTLAAADSAEQGKPVSLE